MIPSSYPSAIRSILVASGCDTALVPPPREYETTDNPIPMDEAIFEYDTSKLFNAAGFSPEATSELDKYWHVRRFYMGQLKILSRNDNEDPTYEKIQTTVQERNIDNVLEMFQQRHQWLENSYKYRADCHPLCKIQDCLNEAIYGSEYCINHLDNDPNQNLFRKCEKCNRMYPVTSSCFFCRE
ncbi:hypothetical protein GPJ56_007451 [Histomonas meleagridis]|uniref:uncharacterized protein n=1 Tax=Histomonas meleagridis TaxID=135588 RepID=UPI0035597E18|nr:hypothetical protein GPJ56_007451 [Histomonas meleagridis]KAH0804297.1 hypothetical protein GO595_003127 [Histomonas meleagridis]